MKLCTMKLWTKIKVLSPYKERFYKLDYKSIQPTRYSFLIFQYYLLRNAENQKRQFIIFMHSRDTAGTLLDRDEWRSQGELPNH